MDRRRGVGRVDYEENDENRIFDGYRYKLHRITDGIEFIICKDRVRRVCQGKGRIINGHFIPDKEHNHAPYGNEDDSVFICRYLRRATLSEMRSVQDIFDAAKNRYPEAASTVNRTCTIRKMGRWRAEMRLPSVQTYLQCHEVLQSEDWRTFMMHDRGRLRINFVTADDNSPLALVFYDTELLHRISESTELFICSTQRSLPNGLRETTQVLIVAANYRGYAVPCAWAWMASRTIESYAGVLRPVFAVINPTLVHTDFERRLHSAIIDSVPLATIRGDFNSYCLNLAAKASEILPNVGGDPGLRELVKKLMALPLLPPNEIRQQFEEIRNNLPREHEERLTLLTDYVEEIWINTVGPNDLSTHMDMSSISDCPFTVIKRLENKLKGRETWSYIRTLLNIFARCAIDIDRINQRLNVSATARIRSLISDNTLHRQWVLLLTEMVTPQRFLSTCSRFVTYLLANLLFRNDPLVQDFLPVRGAAAVDNDEDLYDFPPVNFEYGVNANPQPVALQPPPEPPAVIDEQRGEPNEPDAANGEDEPVAAAAEELPHRAPVENGNDGHERMCVICQSNGALYAAIPCIHVAYCIDCTERLTNLTGRQHRDLRCVICRGQVTEFKRAYVM